MKHPKLHDELLNFGETDSFDFIKDEASARRFAEELGLIPSPYSVPPHHCGVEMKIFNKPRDSALGWVWQCSREKGKKVKGRKMCRAIINPNNGSMFDNLKTPVGDVLAILFCFIMDIGVKKSYKLLKLWRKKKYMQGNKDLNYNDQWEFSIGTICTFFQKFRHYQKIILSNEKSLLLGGRGKTVEIDETFVTKHKYHRGRRTAAMTMTVLGLHCREDKETLFFPVNGKSKRDLWPYIRKYVSRNTSVVCTDKAKQYYGVEQLFNNCLHKSTNHSIGEFVSRSDCSNTINSLENQNRLLKGSLKSRRSREHIQSYIDSYVYRSRYLYKYKDDVGSQIQTFLEHVACIHTTYVNGIKAAPLELVNQRIPSVKSQRIGYAMPDAYKQLA